MYDKCSEDMRWKYVTIICYNPSRARYSLPPVFLYNVK